MAEKEKRRSGQTAGQQGSETNSERAPKMKVTECGVPEQGERVAEAGPPEPDVKRPTAKEVLRDKARDDYRYGGTPAGSDPRE